MNFCIYLPLIWQIMISIKSFAAEKWLLRFSILNALPVRSNRELKFWGRLTYFNISRKCALSGNWWSSDWLVTTYYLTPKGVHRFSSVTLFLYFSTTAPMAHLGDTLPPTRQPKNSSDIFPTLFLAQNSTLSSQFSAALTLKSTSVTFPTMDNILNY